ncbi:MAG: hypothetical protein Q8N44_05785, partial [Rubrivivax sp.]|nr:hypothetical protein [Rubrivivax sp.]
ALAVLSAAALGWAGWRWAAPPTTLSGDWQATLVRGEQVLMTLTQDGDSLTLASAPLPLAGRADWDDYRGFWRQRMGAELLAFSYRGQGQVVVAPGQATRIDIALQLLSSPGDELIDSGNLSARLSADGRRLEGRIWLNSAQADWPALLQR